MLPGATPLCYGNGRRLQGIEFRRRVRAAHRASKVKRAKKNQGPGRLWFFRETTPALCDSAQANRQAKSGLTAFFSAWGRAKGINEGELIPAILQNVAALRCSTGGHGRDCA